ncbi:MAG: hypothetical protein JW839_12535 [Candidatus Lokiarchaeota archaeon]|nr:hypothetical protein [Candidatus Lokiarchaeota archaeon]
MMLTRGSERSQALAKCHAFWLAAAVSYAAILLSLTTVWQLCIIPPAVGSLLFIKERARLAWWSGFLGVGVAWLTIVLHYVATQPAMLVADLLTWIIIGDAGLGWIGAVLTVGIGACLGGFGGVIGFAVQRVLSKDSAGGGGA